MMAPLKTIWGTKHRRGMAATGALLVASLALAIGSIAWATKARTAASLERESQIAAWDSNSAQANEISQVAENYSEQLRRASALHSSGIAASADRVTWVESTLVALKRIAPESYSVQARPAEMLPLPAELQTWYLEQGLESPAFEVTDLDIQIQGTFEDGLLDTLKASMAAGGAIVRTEHCKIVRRPDDAGVDATCRLRRYSLRKAAPEAAS